MGYNLKITFVFLFGTLAGCALGDMSECRQLLPMDEVNALRGGGTLIPDPDKLDPLCDDLQRAYECYAESFMKDPSMFSEENGIMVQGIEASFNYLCMDLKRARSVYAENAKCLQMAEEMKPSCESAAKEGYALYKLSNETELPNERKCFEEAHVFGCIAVHAQKMCGMVARYIFQNFMDEGRFLASVCTPENVEALMKKYLDHLKLDGEVRRIYKETFETARLITM